MLVKIIYDLLELRCQNCKKKCILAKTKIVVFWLFKFSHSSIRWAWQTATHLFCCVNTFSVFGFVAMFGAV